MRVFSPLYFSQVYPLLVDTYWAFGTDTALHLLSLDPWFWAVLGTAVLVALLRKSLRDAAGSSALIVCSLAAAVASAVQHTDWAYHLFPETAIFLLALVYLLGDLLDRYIARWTADRSTVRMMLRGASALAAVFLLLVVIRPHTFFGASRELPLYPDLRRFLAQYKPSTTIYVFSTGVPPLSHAYNLGLNWGSRFAHLWMLPAIVQNDYGRSGDRAPFKRLSQERIQELSSIQRTDIAQDLDDWKPSIVLVERCETGECLGIKGVRFQMIPWFLEDPGFAEAWSHYQPLTGAPKHFELYVRTH